MDLDPQPIANNIPSDISECAHLLILADTAAVRECLGAARQLSEADPIFIPNMMVDHHQKVSNYLFIRSMVLDGKAPDPTGDEDLKIF